MADRKSFKLIKVKTRNCNKSNKLIKINKNKKYITISSDIVEDFKINYGERVDILENNGLFAIEKSTCGLFTVRKYSNSSNIKTVQISSSPLCIYLLAVSKGYYEFEAWVEDNMILFKPIKNK